MKKSEIPTAANNELIADYIHCYARACLNYNFNLPTESLNKHLDDLDVEMLKRGLLTTEQVHALKL